MLVVRTALKNMSLRPEFVALPSRSPCFKMEFALQNRVPWYNVGASLAVAFFHSVRFGFASMIECPWIARSASGASSSM